MVGNSRVFKEIGELPPLNDKTSKWVVAQMEYEGNPLIVRANCTANDWVSHPSLSSKVGCAIPLKNPSPNGLPDPVENAQLQQVEDVIVEEFAKRFSGLLALVLTTGAMRELLFYVMNYDAIDSVKEAIQKQVKTHDIQYLTVLEPDWGSYKKFSPFG